MVDWTFLGTPNTAQGCHPAREHPKRLPTGCIPNMSWCPHVLCARPSGGRSPKHLQQTPSPGRDEHPPAVSAAPSMWQRQAQHWPRCRWKYLLTASSLHFSPMRWPVLRHSPLAHRPCQGGSRPWDPGSPAPPLPPQPGRGQQPWHRQSFMSQHTQIFQSFLPVLDSFLGGQAVLNSKWSFPTFLPTGCCSGGPLLSRGLGRSPGGWRAVHSPAGASVCRAAKALGSFPACVPGREETKEEDPGKGGRLRR